MSCAGSRDNITYSTQFIRGSDGERVLDYMFDAVASPKFRKWETSGAHAKVKVQCAELSGQAKAIENLHKAAYRARNSNYAPHEPSQASFH